VVAIPQERKLKICMIGTGVAPIPPERGGGVERVVFNLARGLTELGQEVAVIDTKGGSEGGIRFKRVLAPKLKGLGRLSPILTELLFAFLAVPRARGLRKEVDVFHVHTSMCGFVFALFKGLLGRPLVYSSYNPDWSLPPSELSSPSRLMMRIEGFCIGRADAVIASSEAAGRGMQKLNSPFIIHNFVDAQTFSPRRSRFKERLGIRGPMVLFVGKLTPAKGVGHLLRAAKKVVEQRPDVKFVLVGPTSFLGEGENPWKELQRSLGLEENVIFTGGLPFSELLEAYASADIFVLPSLKEAFSTVVLEAMAFGLPVVASRIPGIMEAVSEENGILVEKGEVDQLAEAILHLVENDRERKRMGANSRKRVLRYFTVRLAAEKHLEVYRRVCQD
jgi:glycosyltransferase involved in cell wall biosynthesis